MGGEELSRLLDTIEVLGRKIGEMAENEDDIYAWDMEIRDNDATLTIVLWDKDGRPVVYEPEIQLAEDGFFWMDIHTGDGYCFDEIREMLKKGYYNEDVVKETLQNIIKKCHEILNKGRFGRFVDGFEKAVKKMEGCRS